MELKEKGYIEYNDIRVNDLEKGELYIDIKKKHLNPYRIVHGGLLYTLADTAMGVSLTDIGYFTTISSNINFIKACKGTRISTKVERLKVTKNMAFLNCYIYDNDDNLIASANGTYYLYKEK